MRENASFLDTLLFRYAKPLLDSSTTQRIRFEQYGELPDRLKICHEAEKLQTHIDHYTEKNPADKYAFMKGIVSANQARFALFLVVRFCLSLKDFIIPVLTVQFMDWITSEHPDTYYSTAIALAAALAIPALQVAVHLIWEYFCFYMIETGHRAHTSLKTILFAKNLRMSNATNKDFDSSEIESVIMEDTNVVWQFIWKLPEIVEVPFRLVVSCYLTFQYVGWYGAIVVAVTLLKFLTSYIKKHTEKDLREELRTKTDKRMQHVNESFQNIKGVKLYGWENKFLKKIEGIYQEANDLNDQQSFRDNIYAFIDGFIQVSMFPLVYGLYVGNGNALELGAMAMANCMMGKIQGSINQLDGIYRELFEIDETMTRLNKFYTAAEVQKGLINKVAEQTDSEHAVSIQGNFSWGVNSIDKEQREKQQEKAYKEDQERLAKSGNCLSRFLRKSCGGKRKSDYEVEYTPRNLNSIINLKDIDLKIHKGEFTVIIGEVGSGKTSLLNAMLGEMIYLPEQEVEFVGDATRKLSSAEQKALEHTLLTQDFSNGCSPVTLEGSTAYVECNHWIQNGKFRENVCFGSDFEERRYVETVKACQFEQDIKMMPAGDLTEIGEKGINLSGGQKARVCLARAVYKRPDVILMDDPISALDSHTRKAIFQDVFQGLLKDSTRVLVTHAVDFVHLADRIVIMDQGKITAQGTYEELKNNEYMLHIKDIHQRNKDEIAKANEQANAELQKVAEGPSEEAQPQQAPAPVAKTQPKSERLSDEEIKQALKSFEGAKAELDEKTSEIVGKLLVSEQDEQINAGSSAYYRLLEMTGFSVAAFVLINITVFKYAEAYKGSLIQGWADASPEEQFANFYGYMKTLVITSYAIMALRVARDFVMDRVKRSIGRHVHKETLERVLQAPVNVFFDVTPLGKILSIFNGDLRVFYGLILAPLQHMCEMGSHVVVVLSMLYAVGDIYVLLALCLMVLLVKWISRPYLHADNQLHKVGSSLWTPIRSFFHESMRGTTIIRAFGQEKTIMARQSALLDDTTTHFIAHHSCWCWYNIRIFTATKIFSLCTIYICFMNKGLVSNVSLVMLMNWSMDMPWLMHFFGCLNWFMRMMVQVQRVFNLQEAPQEKLAGTEKPAESWPQQGKIEFKDVELRYRPNTDVVLRKLNFAVTPGHKVGIVGRTGAGKSTISMALTRIVELMGGKIEIDGVDVSKLDLADLRSQITMIPQDPIMFLGTLRYNLDPFDEHSDERILELVKKAGLEYLLEGVSKQELKERELAAKAKAQKEETSDTDASSADDAEPKEDTEQKKEEISDDDKGLNFKVKEEGKNLSIGERQLICIIRAVLRCNKIVILDEATANIDVVTEQATQRLISEEFQGATVLCIAHRLNTIIKSDRVLVMDKGQAIEYDSPQALMANPNSTFSRMLQEKKRAME